MSRKTINRMIAASAWILVALIVYGTLTHSKFVYAIYYKLQPFMLHTQMKAYAHVEHVLAFAALGALFALAYPRRLILVCAVVLGGAAALEILQTLTPDRHGTWPDAVEKVAAGALGIAAARIILGIRRARENSAGRPTKSGSSHC
ncbi:MAG: VanZ family protein [Bradyrhizobium sp.]|uniref:VanZ family protein n=1 Tax=Bradyrhizobium sp. TaxID=376 RepID=UPI0025C67FAC|nr:VanZ family protein [Bradyrhizobium sp.]MBI5263384.1 VanZ family protein [Bradyrhizobium sp.]